MSTFQFYTSTSITEIIGKKARNLIELLEGIKTVPGSSIYCHTHRFLQQHHFLSPEPPNNFAYWLTNILQESKLGEQFASVDIIQYKSIRQLREKFISLIEEHLKSNPEIRNAPNGHEFYFMKSKSFVIPTKYSASNLEEFYNILKRISIHSLYFHMFESRSRLEQETNDFARWLSETLGENELAKEIAKLDLYPITLEGLRQKMCNLIERRLYGRFK